MDGEPQKTKAVAGKLNPVFPKGTTNFTFEELLLTQLPPCDFRPKLFQSKYLSVDIYSSAICLPIPLAQMNNQ